MILYLLYSTGPTRKQPHHSTIQWAIAQNHGRPEVLLPGKRNYQVRSEAHERLSPNRTKTENMWILASGETLVPKTWQPVATTLYSNLPWSSLTLLFIMVKPTQFKSIAILIFQPINPEPFHRCDGCVAFGHINLAWVSRTKSALDGGRAKKNPWRQ